MTNVSINENCDPLMSHPFWVFFVSLLCCSLLLPLILFYTYWDSRYERGKGDIQIADVKIYFPSISKTWRNNNSVIPVFTGAFICVVVYSICLLETGNKICLVLGLVLALFVFSFNTESGPMSITHAVFAFTLFTYILWLIYALRIYYPENYPWYWPYPFLGVFLLVMLQFVFTNYFLPVDLKASRWPHYVNFCEYLYIITFLIYVLLVP